MKNALLWLAQGCGVGKIPVAPGTFGSVLGMAWFVLLLQTGHWWAFLAGAGAGLLVSVWLCDVSEKVLRQKDPGTVVFDEITAMPVCFISWMALAGWRTGAMPGAEFFFSHARWAPTLGVFAAFRFFDILKPWPARQSQALPGGWGVTVDDALAAVYVNLLVLAVEGGRILLGG